MPIEDLMRGLEDLADTRMDYELAELYYRGRNPELFASIKIARALRMYEAKYRLRLAKIPVDAVVDRLEIAAVTVASSGSEAESEDIESPPATEDQSMTQFIQDEIRDLHNMELEEANLHKKACMYGDAYLIVDQDEETDDLEFFYNSPFECRVIYDRSGRYKEFAIKAWTETDEATRQEYRRATLFYSDALEEWATKAGTDGANPSDWIPFGEGTPQLDAKGRVVLKEGTDQPIIIGGVYPHDLGRIPVFHFRNDTPYGCPEHEAAYGPQDMIDKLVITQMATVDFQGFPQRYALQDPNAIQDQGEEWDEDDASATTTSKPQPQLKAGPGELWWLEGAKTAGQFEVANADAFLKPMDRYARAMSTVTNTPLHLFDPQGQVPSGESRRTAEAGQTKKVRRRQKQFGATWREVYGYCVQLLTGKDITNRIDVRWVPAESIDPAEAWDLAAKKKGVGMPMRQILLEHGYTEDQIDDFEKQALEERKVQIELQREAFQSTMQGNRQDRPDVPNPDNVPGGGGDQGQ